MNVSLEAIKFNHDSNSAATDGLNIRRNETRPVTVPEWQQGTSVNPEDSPAAYSLCDTFGNTLTIQAKFKCSDTDTQAIEVRALDATLSSTDTLIFSFIRFFDRLLPARFRSSAANVLGEVKRRYVYFSDGESDFETFELEGVRIWAGGVGLQDIAWRWQYRLPSSSSWTDFATTRHRIYIILREPTSPWIQTPFADTNVNLPWAEVLDYACRWAAGAKNVDEAATQITRKVYDLGPQTIFYPKNDTSSHYVSETFNFFKCTKFLERLGGGEGKGRHVNCTDCAAIVSTFANAIGCDLWVSQMGALRSNPIKLIGQSAWTVHSFDFHEVAWKGACDANEPVFDACLLVDGDDYPDRSPHKPLLPVNLRFGGPDDEQYRFRLVSPESGRNSALPKPATTRTRRRVSRADRVMLGSVNLGLAEDRSILINLEIFHTLNRAEENPFVHLFASEMDEMAGWQLNYFNYMSGESDGPSLLETFWIRPNSDTETNLSLDFYECADEEAAHAFLPRLVAGFQMPVLKPQDKVGTAAYVGPEDVTVLFARSRFVTIVRNAGRQMVSVWNIAVMLDELILNRTNLREE